MNDLLETYLRFCILTGISFSINFGLTALLHDVLGVSAEASFAAALATVYIVNFILKRYYVYRARSGDIKRQMVLYALSAVGFRSAEYLAFLLVHTGLGLHYLLSIFLVLFVSFMVKFFYYKNVVFLRYHEL